MALNTGTKLGTYEVVGLLGAGGMGEVYRARDMRLKRDVAIKSLPDTLAGNSEHILRFQREAEMLASLNDANIAGIYDIEEVGDSRFLVLELVEGETLAGRIAHGPVQLGEALQIGKQIAEALEAAHEKGIIHRDLKPANVKITTDGKVKVLDFGLAKLHRLAETDIDIDSALATITGASNVVLGTPAYMSPEQAKGEQADRTTDVWAFGCVLYEMLTGHRPFKGASVGETIGAVLNKDPDWKRLPVETPEAIRRLLRRTLTKERKHRIHDIADVRLEIEDAVGPRREPASESATRPASRVRFYLVMVTLVIAAVAISSIVRRERAIFETRLDVVTLPTADPVSFALSADGQHIVFVGTADGRNRLWLRSLRSGAVRLLEGTDAGAFPFFSPDGRSIGFFAEGKLKRFEIESGVVQVLVDAPSGRGGTWNRDGTILFAPSSNNGAIFRVSATGGESIPVTTLVEPQEAYHRFPQFLPDGNHFLFHVEGPPEVRGVYVADLNGSMKDRITEADYGLHAYLSTGHLLFVRQGTLFAQPFDPDTLKLAGPAFRVAEQVLGGALSVSEDGVIAYRTRSGAGRGRQFVWFDRSGREIEKIGDPDDDNESTNGPNPALSADGRRIAINRNLGGNVDIWLLETQRGVFNRFTYDPGVDNHPLWSPDGGQVVFSSVRMGVNDLYIKSSTSAASEERLLTSPHPKTASDWSADGRFLLYRSNDPRTKHDIWALPMDGKAEPFPVRQTNFAERDAQFSGDGTWIAYESDESGRPEIYVQPFARSGSSIAGRWPVSINGGAQARWRADGTELFYIALDGQLMAVPTRFVDGGQTIEIGSPVALFATRIGGALQGTNKQQYVVSADGQRFLMSTIAGESMPSPITIISNWQSQP